MKKAPLLFLLMLVSLIGFGQNFTISGHLKDKSTGEDLLYASVLVTENSQGVTTNQYGYYAISLPKGTYTVKYSYLGYETQSLNVTLDKDVTIDVELGPASTTIEEVVVVAQEENENITNTEMGVVGLPMKEIKKIPVLLGEQDVLKTIQLMPGVSASSEGSSGFFVRGGNSDQNLILLDEAPVYNASHLLGFFSVFNGDAIKDMKLYKGTQPARYGGRASSVVDIRMKDGNKKNWGATGGLGLISSRLTVEGPIVKDKGSIMISGRRTYLDFLVRSFSEQFSGTNLYFYDLNLKANYQLGEKDRIYLSGYLGRDVMGINDFGFDWGNKTATLRWNHIFSSNLFSNTSFIYSDYDYGFNLANAGVDVDLNAGIYDYNLKQDYTYYLNSNNTIEFGWNGIYHQFKPSVFTFDETVGDAVQERDALEGGIYLANTQKLTPKLTLSYGLRLSSFSNIGNYTEKKFNDNDEVIEETTYANGEFYNNYFTLEPRVNATYVLNQKSSIKASYNRNAQYIHLLSNSTSGTPTDMWLPSTPLVKPTIADQYSLGYFRNLKDNAYKFSVEGYYKNLQNVVDYENGAETFGNPDIESELVFGQGRSYGIEFLLEKQKGKFTGWIGYTLSKVERQFDEINQGEWFSARQDRTHDLSFVGMYELSPKISLSASWVYSTGDAVTFPAGKYYIDGELVNLYTERNGSRMPDYHRMDIGMTYTIKDTKKSHHDLNLSLYNVYNRKNAYTITFAENASGESEATRLALFGIVPSLTWNFKF